MKVTTILAVATIQSLAAQAATIYVNSTADQIADTGTCTIREAIIAANTNAPSGATPGECASGNSGSTDVIVIPAGTYALTRVGSEQPYETNAAIGDLDATQSLTIIGAGRDSTVLDGAALDARILQIEATSGAFAISNLTMRNGSELSFPTAANGGGLAVDGPVTGVAPISWTLMLL